MNVISGFVTTFCFSLLFNVSKKHLVSCGFVGALGWGIYTAGEMLGYSTVLSTFVASWALAQLSYFLAKSRLAPVTVFLIPGIIPLVPGVGLYRTMYSLLFADYNKALGYALLTFQLSGVIAGAIIIAALMPLLFRPKRQKKWPLS
ncbi:MAG: threonine/serine exporter family protein [Cellulosilyticaceae bacterium]